MGKSKLYIQSGSTLIECTAEEGIVWETNRKSVPGKLTFTVVKDEEIAFQEGNSVRFEYDGSKIFFGFVFTKKRSSNDLITVTCYDQLRYFKNKDTYVYENKTASELLKMLATDFRLQLGAVENTVHKIAVRAEENKELFDIIQNALDETLQYRKAMYVLYDDFGKLNLRNIETLRLDLLIDEESGESFDYTSSIDSNTYNKIKLVRENKETGKREVYIAKDSNSINNWGVLQYFETMQESTNGKVKADVLLAMFNRKSRSLSLNKVFGDSRVRGGSSLAVKMYLGDLNVANFMIVESVKHTFMDDEYHMDLRMIGGDFVA